MHKNKTPKTLSLATLALLLATNLSQSAWSAEPHQQGGSATHSRNTNTQGAASVRARLSAHNKKWSNHWRRSRNDGGELPAADFLSTGERQAKRAARARKNLSSDAWRTVIADVLLSNGINLRSDPGRWAQLYYEGAVKAADLVDGNGKGSSEFNLVAAYKTARTRPGNKIVVKEVDVPPLRFQGQDDRVSLSAVKDHLNSKGCAGTRAN